MMWLEVIGCCWEECDVDGYEVGQGLTGEQMVVWGVLRY